MAVRVGTGFIVGFSTGILAYKFGSQYVGINKNVLIPKEEKVDGNLLKSACKILKYGAPQGPPALSYYKNFVLHYDQERKIPKWVAEHITAEHVSGEAHRSKCKFRSDPSIPEMFRSSNSDYLHSMWSRGHMAPAGDNKHDQAAMNETFFLSNILPQNLENNGGYWNRLEIYCRGLSEKYDDVYILSGPVFMSKDPADNERRYINHQVIGRNEVAAPTHLFKVVMATSKHSDPELACFIIPNTNIKQETPLTKFQVPLESLEKKTGLTIHPHLDRSLVSDLCKTEGCKLMPWSQFELYMLDRKMKSAKTMANLNKYWEDARRKNVQFDKQAKETYRQRKEELEHLQKMTKDGLE